MTAHLTSLVVRGRSLPLRQPRPSHLMTLLHINPMPDLSLCPILSCDLCAHPVCMWVCLRTSQGAGPCLHYSTGEGHSDAHPHYTTHSTRQHSARSKGRAGVGPFLGTRVLGEGWLNAPHPPRSPPLGPHLRVSLLARTCLCWGVGSSCSSEVREGSEGLDGTHATPNDGHNDTR